MLDFEVALGKILTVIDLPYSSSNDALLLHNLGVKDLIDFNCLVIQRLFKCSFSVLIQISVSLYVITDYIDSDKLISGLETSWQFRD